MTNDYVEIIRALNVATHRFRDDFSSDVVFSLEDAAIYANQRINVHEGMGRPISESIGYTSGHRTISTQSVIEALQPKHVMEIGLGYGGTTYQELCELGKKYHFEVCGVELVDYFARSLPNVYIADVCHPTRPLLEQISQMDIIRCSNTAIPWFVGELFSLSKQPDRMSNMITMFFGIMENYLKENSKLIISHSPSSKKYTKPGFCEEGFLYIMQNGELNLKSYLYSIWANVEGITWGGNTNFSLINSNNIEHNLITGPLLESEDVIEQDQQNICLESEEINNFWNTIPAEETMQHIVTSLIYSNINARKIGNMISVPIEFVSEIAEN
jgi:hypothetical protein